MGYKIGQRVEYVGADFFLQHVFGGEYIISHVGNGNVALLNVKTGNIFTDHPVRCNNDPVWGFISEEIFSDICNKTPADFLIKEQPYN